MLVDAWRTQETVEAAHEASTEFTKIHVVFKTHLDLGYTDLEKNVLRSYREEFIPGAIRLARDMADQHGRPEFVWTTGSWLITHALRDGTAAERADLDAAIRDGLVAWHAYPVTTQTELLSRSMLDHAMTYSARLDAEYGRKTTAAKMTDVPGHTIGLVSALAAAGVNYLHIGVNPASPVPDVPEHAVWRAPDGSEIVLSYDPAYGSDPERATVRPVPGSTEGLFFSFTNDNHGPPVESDVRGLLERLRERYPSADVVASDLNGFGQAAWDARDALPVVTQEIGDSWIYGMAADPIATGALTRLDRLRDEWLADGRLTLDDPTDRELAEQLMLIAEHTCGYSHMRYLPDYVSYDKDLFHVNRERDVIDVEQTIPPTLSYARWALTDGVQQSYSHAMESWDEKRANALAIVPNLPDALRAEAQRELDQSVPDAPASAQPVDRTATADRVVARIGDDGSLVGLQIDGQEILADPDGIEIASRTLGAYEYWTYGAADVQQWVNDYVREPYRNGFWAIPELGKAGLELLRPVPKTRRFLPRVIEAVTWASDGVLHLRSSLRLPDEACESAGGPRRITVEHAITPGEVHGATVRTTLWLGEKDAIYAPESSWLRFDPATRTPSRWRLQKAGSLVDPLDVVRDGGRTWHAVEAARYDDVATKIVVEPLDAPVLSLGRPRMYEFDNDPGSAADGFAFTLHNNAWSTNFRPWFDDDSRYEFVTRLRRG
ncbi:DUF5054 domain-containing protein [Microbacterium sp. H1-D42]|uniref:DUF5054 domain-containing protein n=1 Tax=Microbacterium sp. H1-D42 TaxID=2925844 RepID=UPI001F53AB9D|nr:DUF5054 domain-containing protein [Microbacterium sp. H1-D42]UNK70496.1 DUF5054 domain-containing protein [Microbacterium sp. H1-D42]